MRITSVIPQEYCNFLLQNVTEFSLPFLFLFFFFYLSSLILWWSLWLYLPGLQVSLIQNALWSWQAFGWSGFLKAVLISLFTLFVSSPFSHFSDCLVFLRWDWWKVIMEAGRKISTSLFFCLSLVSPPRWNFNVLSSHFYILSPAIILIHLSLCPLFHCLHLSLHISLYTPHTPPTHTH